MYKEDLALNNQQWLIWHQTKLNEEFHCSGFIFLYCIIISQNLFYNYRLKLSIWSMQKWLCFYKFIIFHMSIFVIFPIIVGFLWVQVLDSNCNIIRNDWRYAHANTKTRTHSAARWGILSSYCHRKWNQEPTRCIQ